MTQTTKIAWAAAALAVAGVSATAAGATAATAAGFAGRAVMPVAPMPATVVWLCLAGLASAAARRPAGLWVIGGGRGWNRGGGKRREEPMQLRDFDRAG
jgi:hypothetical protein